MTRNKGVLIGLLLTVSVVLTIPTGCGAIISLGQECGGIAGIPCEGPFFCFFESDCGAADMMGVCQPIPEVCIEVFEPVCGCDGQTYSNECKAWANGVNVAFDGECEQSP